MSEEPPSDPQPEPSAPPAFSLRRALAVIGPGILVAATGVGAGDLATAAFTGSEVGVVVLWAVVFGAVLKFALTEGLARFQLASDETLLEGAVRRLGRPVAWVFVPYLLLWSFFVGSALMSACGVTLVAIFPVLEPATGKVVCIRLPGVRGSARHASVGAAWTGLAIAVATALSPRVQARDPGRRP